ncbi:hypothetical protein [Saccharothrix variisporea]|uniref:ABC-2 type transport system permease protein n=1 Tax=Saccharothrix variisporea TaxID=543527 RepID=A0A495XMS5_9PSEU|nr:hypothetical protein [Saccharothrix variisporea]RKT74505.1 ABC-2 type transport system permease protein [Saccharothrix variisporea]
MTLWRLEWLRLVRTHRLVALCAVFGLFGLVGPISVRYLPEIIRRFGGVEVVLPPATPADGMAGYVKNAVQLGLLVLVLVAAAALAFDAQRDSAVFLRTRVPALWRIVVPKVVVNAAAGAGAFTVGAMAAWYETAVLLGALPVGRTLLGIACMAAYLAFAVALTALTAALLRGVVGTALTCLGVLLLSALLEPLGGFGRWLPSRLVGALDGLLRGATPSSYLPALALTAALAVAATATATALLSKRDV